jgi:hypothetical protein
MIYLYVLVCHPMKQSPYHTFPSLPVTENMAMITINFPQRMLFYFSLVSGGGHGVSSKL